jgi:hypothetical protein
MAEPISVPIETDPDEIAAIGFDFIESLVPGWNRARGDAMSQHIAAVARMIAEGRETASDVPTTILRYLGRWVDELLPVDALPAQTTATVTALDNAGYAIPDGTRFVVRTSGDSGEIFVAVGTVTIPPLSTSTAAGEVVLVAEVEGAAGSGLPIDSDVEPVDALAWISSVVLTAVTTGGRDAETDEQYITRWIAHRRLAHISPTRAADSAAVLLALVPGIGRALALDGYNPATATYNNEKYVTVAVADVTGEPVSGTVKTQSQALLESLRLLNSVAPVIDPTYTTIDVSTAFGTHPGFDPDGVESAVISALTAYLSPAAWGTPTDADVTSWAVKTHARYLELAAVIDRVEGVDEITALTLGRVLQVTGLASTDVLTSTAHGLLLDYPVVFAGLTGGAPLVAGTTYFARDITANTFKVAATAGGAAINVTTDLTAGTIRSLRPNDVPLAGPAPLTRPGTLAAVGTAP